MKFGEYDIDDNWIYEANSLGSKWYRTAYWNKHKYENVFISDIQVVQHFPNDFWYLYFQHYIFREEYIMMYGEDFEFPTLELGKDRVDRFLEKLVKLKAFL